MPKSKVKMGRNEAIDYRSPKDLALRFPALQNNRDTMKLLVSYPEFQEDVKEARKYLEIPPIGIDQKDDQVNQKWHDDFIKRTDKLTASEAFKMQERAIREKLKNKEIDIRMANKQSRLLYSKLPVNYFTQTCKYLVEKFNLPGNFDYYIHQYILFNIVGAPPRNFVIGPFELTTPLSEVRQVTVTIYAKLTDDELKWLKEEINRFGKKLPKFNKLKDIDKKLNFEQWLANPEQYDPVTNTKYKMSRSEIAENIFGDGDPKKAYESLRELKEIRRKRFGKN